MAPKSQLKTFGFDFLTCKNKGESISASGKERKKKSERERKRETLIKLQF